MRFVLTREAEEFARRALPFLEARIECNVIAGVLSDARSGRYGKESCFGYGLDDAHQVVFAALRTPPRPLLVSPLEPEQAPEFVAEWLGRDPILPGVNGLTETVRAIAAAWCAETGGTVRPGLRQAMHSLTEVEDPPRPAAGRLQVAADGEFELVARWWGDFSREAGVGVRQSDAIVSSRLSQGRIFLWDHDGPASLVAIAAEVAGVVRIGPVYTPPERRRRGYAGTAVAALSRLALKRGAHTCMLYTDLSNPTSNKIYAEVGYRRMADWAELRFTRRPG